VIAFLDASALIYLVDGDAFSAEAVKQQLLQLAAAAQASRFDIRLAISRLSWLECRVGPLRRSDPTALGTPDALQAACCQQLGPSAVMVTGDAGFQRVPGLPVALVQGALPPRSHS